MMMRVNRQRAVIVSFVFVTIAALGYRHRWDPVFDPINEVVVGRSLATARPLLAADTSGVFLFRAQDCPAAKDFIVVLDSLARAGRPVVAALVGDSVSVPHWREIVASSGVAFPAMLISSADAGVIARRVNRGMTPAFVLYDRIGQRFQPPDKAMAAWLRAWASTR